MIETPCGIRGRWKSRLGEEIDDLVEEAAELRAGLWQTLGKMVGFVSIGDLVKYRIDKIEAEAAAMREYIQGA